MLVDAQVKAVVVGQGATVNACVCRPGSSVRVSAIGADDGGVGPAAGVGPLTSPGPFIRDFVIGNQGSADGLVVFEAEVFAGQVIFSLGAGEG